MDRIRNGRRLAGATALALLVGAVVPAQASPAATCGMQLGLDYVSAADSAAPGDPIRVRLTLGSGPSKVTVEAVRFFLQCNARASRLLPCVQDGPVVAYAGDETITTDCPVAWSTGHAGGPRPNQLVFTPDAPLDVPANTPSFCALEFDVIVLDGSRDATPEVIEQMAGLGFSRADAGCDNGLRAAAAIMGGIRLAP
jgi:hypothetical protein